MPTPQSINHDLGQRLQALTLAELPDALARVGSDVETKLTQRMIAAISGVS